MDQVESSVPLPTVRGSRALHRYATPEGAAAYAQKYSGRASRIRTDRIEHEILGEFVAHSSSDCSLLNLPCGAGRFADHLGLDLRRDVTFSDRSSEMVAEASRRLAEIGRAHVAMRASDIIDEPVGRSFDLVLCVRLLHHIFDDEDRRRALDHLCAASSNMLILTIASTSTWKGFWRDVRTRLHLRRPGERIEQLSTIRRDLEARGFDIHQVRFVSRWTSTQTWLLARRRVPDQATTDDPSGLAGKVDGDMIGACCPTRASTSSTASQPS